MMKNNEKKQKKNVFRFRSFVAASLYWFYFNVWEFWSEIELSKERAELAAKFKVLKSTNFQRKAKNNDFLFLIMWVFSFSCSSSCGELEISFSNMCKKILHFLFIFIRKRKFTTVERVSQAHKKNVFFLHPVQLFFSVIRNSSFCFYELLETAASWG